VGVVSYRAGPFRLHFPPWRPARLILCGVATVTCNFCDFDLLLSSNAPFLCGKSNFPLGSFVLGGTVWMGDGYRELFAWVEDFSFLVLMYMGVGEVAGGRLNSG
jgi:hypothetical protein